MHADAVDEQLSLNNRYADRLMIGVLWCLFVMALALAGAHGTLGWAVAVGLPAAAIPTFLLTAFRGVRAGRIAVGVAFMVFCALHIHQSLGRTEVHFGIFALLAFLLCYRDRLVILAAAGTVALHHFAFNYLQTLGYPGYCLTQPGLDTVLVHAAYVVAETAVLCYLAGVLRREAMQAAELHATVRSMTAHPDRIDLLPGAAAPAGGSARALHGVVASIRRTLAGVQDSVRKTVEASSLIAEGSAQLSRHTARQSESIRNTVGAMSALTAIVERNAEDSRRADALACSAAQVAGEGGEVVGQVVATMDAINAASRRIAEITGVIDGIAFQTNILALNAAVEAARAGEQGRGFAVVAGEVRNLAQRAAVAAKEIKGLIEDSVRQVNAGSTQARRAGDTMEAVVASVQQVSGIISSISAASREQAQGIAGIGRALEQMEQSTRSSAGRVTDAADAAAALSVQAHQLAGMVEVFRVEGGTPPSCYTLLPC